MKPVVKALKEKYGDKIVFVVADVTTESGEKLASQYKIWGVPTIYLIKDEEIVYQKIGHASQQELENVISKITE